MSGSVRPILLSALTLLAVGGLAMTPTSGSAAVQDSSAGQPGAVALVSTATAFHQHSLAPADPPAGQCMLGGWNASWPSGTRVAITFTTSVSCGTGLTVTTSVTSILHAAGGAAESTAPTAQGNTPGTIASSATSTRFARPTTHYVEHKSTSTLHPSSAGTLVWQGLPAGCTGAGTATATCDINEPSFTI
ncbi:hypothetical protein GCM10009765_55390 [Fodinicola feengrottensis]|uniref:Uncharacterized protein n=1 Tax=Fodinicola feengrottensis TaxID=435914 RepID=A0ABN2I574_9ACTN